MSMCACLSPLHLLLSVVIGLYIQSEKKLFHGPISNPCYYFPYYYGKLAQLSSLRGDRSVQEYRTDVMRAPFLDIASFFL
nr:MAG TPA: hypothetical protein [Caudoviricetes sp.]